MHSEAASRPGRIQRNTRKPVAERKGSARHALSRAQLDPAHVPLGLNFDKYSNYRRAQPGCAASTNKSVSTGGPNSKYVDKWLRSETIEVS